MSVGVRLVHPDDADRLAELVRVNRDFLTPYEPARPESYFTVEGQRRAIDDGRRLAEAGTAWPGVVTLDGSVVGRMNLQTIVRGPFQSTDLGYWVDETVNGRGVASAAVAAVLRVAFTDLGLHRVQASTLVDNLASQAVLARNRFEPIGRAPRYLAIDGRWQDFLLFQRLTPTDADPAGP